MRQPADSWEQGSRSHTPEIGKGVVSFIGPSGSGKTVIGERTALLTGWSLLDTDAHIMAKLNASRISDIFDSRGEDFFRHEEVKCVDVISNMPGSLIVATGGGLPAIPGMMALLNRIGVTVYLKASLDTLWKRLNTDPRQLENRPLLRVDGRATLARMLAEREEIYLQATLALDTDRLSVDEVCALLVTQIDSMQKITMGGMA